MNPETEETNNTDNQPVSETPNVTEAAPAPQPSAPAITPDSKGGTILVGMDLGTNSSCVCQSTSEETNIVIPTVVGYAEDGILQGILPGNASVLYGNDAIKNELHLRMVRPLVDGVIDDVDSAAAFLKHSRELVDPKHENEVRAVIGMPAKSDDKSKQNLEMAVNGAFDAALFIPEPFLAALGFRDDSQLNNPEYIDPVKNSLFIDIGAGTTDFCIIQGYFPTPEDQLSIPFAGDDVDKLIADAIKETYPETRLSMNMIRKFKEEFSYVGEIEYGMRVKVPIAGKPLKLEIGEQVGQACNILLDEIFKAVQQVIAMASTESVFDMLQNIIITGGGSRIRSIAIELQRLLLEEGYENPNVSVAGSKYKEFVAMGAYKAATGAREQQWLKL